MTLDLTSPGARTEPRSQRPLTQRERRRERRRLAAEDRVGARLAELGRLEALLTDAAEVVATGWVQGGWFAYRDDTGHQRLATVGTSRMLAGRPVTGACLVGAVVQAGGGPTAAHGQPVQRALDLTWHTLWGRGLLPDQWCAAPATRVAHVRQLTAWNDRPERSRDEVTGLLGRSAWAAATEAERLRGR